MPRLHDSYEGREVFIQNFFASSGLVPLTGMFPPASGRDARPLEAFCHDQGTVCRRQGTNSRRYGKASRSFGATSRRLITVFRGQGTVSRSQGKNSRSLGKASRSFGTTPRSLFSVCRGQGTTSRSFGTNSRSLGKLSRSFGTNARRSCTGSHDRFAAANDRCAGFGGHGKGCSCHGAR